MSEFDIEAAIKLVADIGLRPAARHYDLSHTTLSSRIKAHEARRARAPELKTEPQTLHNPSHNLSRVSAERGRLSVATKIKRAAY